ncbi:glycoside hydrolase family 76 protein [Rhypophila decipiens]
MRWNLCVAGAASLLVRSAAAIELNLENEASIKDAASTIAFGLLKFYTGNNTGDTPGNLPDPYFWWEAGAMFGTMIDYWFLTGDTSYNEATTQAMLHQAAPTKDFQPINQTRTSGNDDQGFWAMSAMTAAENKYPDPPEDQPQWLALAQAVFNQYTTRWDDSVCGGGLRWQINTFSNGFMYKNSISNGCFFSLASRLARFTGNQTYADWAEKIFDWEVRAGLILEDGSVYDGVGVPEDGGPCTSIDKIQWSYNHGIFLHGAAVMSNITNSAPVWKKRVESILDSTIKMFFKQDSKIMFEQFCEDRGFCDIDQQSFKGYLTRWMSVTSQMAPYTFEKITPLLRTSAVAAAKACSGSPATGFNGIPGTACGMKWTTGTFDGLPGVGEQMNALSSVMYTLRTLDSQEPFTADNGGTSRGDPNAGQEISEEMKPLRPIESKDRVAAAFITTFIALGAAGGCAFVMI